MVKKDDITVKRDNEGYLIINGKRALDKTFDTGESGGTVRGLTVRGVFVPDDEWGELDEQNKKLADALEKERQREFCEKNQIPKK